MSLTFQIETLQTKSGKKTFVARSKAQGTLTEIEVYERMTKNSGIESVDAQRFMMKFAHVLMEAIQNGESVRTPFGKFSPFLTGTFESPTEKFSPKKHKIQIRYSPNPEMLKSVQIHSKPKKKDPNIRRPFILSIENTSRPKNQITKNNDLIQILGGYIKIHPKYPGTGLELIPKRKNMPPVSIPLNLIPVHEHRKIVFQVSSVPKGTYRIRIHALVGRKVIACDSDETIRVG